MAAAAVAATRYQPTTLSASGRTAMATDPNTLSSTAAAMKPL
ncbi:Uncharacterised protein [Mycobacterium tuberculosis]|uniref:Uncharacterized protein n=1 Tax=Mycobacterium tuberculosis TaxID=1773 RepID=A0A655FYX0_MYCTX|nr:Uncharacterised protein [Mycobacterium tuberculosis]CKU16999.1 Uncharacterised protein [Mycobacterium tuberculosis]CNX48753.1 Uncharacterised protein [Mycobacterium tuberculosis]COZ70994.1 Uncharacterised protein [Mycobacterium tuberculosis]